MRNAEAQALPLPRPEILALEQSLETLNKLFNLPREKLERALKNPKVQVFLQKMSDSMSKNTELQNNSRNAEQALSTDLQDVSETLNTSLTEKAKSMFSSVGNFTLEKVQKHPLPAIALVTLLGYGLSHPSQMVDVVKFLTWVATHPIEATVAGVGGIVAISAGIKGALHSIVPAIKASGSTLFEAVSSFVSKQATISGAEVASKMIAPAGAELAANITSKAAPFVLPEMGIAAGGELTSSAVATGAKAVAGEAATLGVRSIATEAAMAGLRGLGTVAGVVASLPFTAVTAFFAGTGTLNAGEEEMLKLIKSGAIKPF